MASSDDLKSQVLVRRVVSRFESVQCDSPNLSTTYGLSAQSSERVAVLMRSFLEDEVVEVFSVLLLDGRHRVIGLTETSRGTLTTALVHPREVFGAALRLAAAAVIVVHNHPSGDPEPSLEDVSVTKRLVEAGRLLGVPLLDHVILGEGGRYSSLRGWVEF